MLNLESITIDREVLDLIPRQTAVELSVLPLSRSEDVVIVATPEIIRQEMMNSLQRYLGKKVKPVPVPRDALLSAIHRFYGPAALEPHPVIISRNNVVAEPRKRPNRTIPHELSAESLTSRLIDNAIDMGANEIQIEPSERTLSVRYRVDGVLHEVPLVPINKINRVVLRLKIMANMNIDERRKPQEARMQIRHKGKVIHFRLSVIPRALGDMVIIRFSDRSHSRRGLDKLGLETGDLILFRRALGLPAGLILIAGPEESGRTTTLYAALRTARRPGLALTGVDDGFEGDATARKMIPLHASNDGKCESILTDLSRHKAQMMTIGEIRDGPTCRLAVEAALSGHLVLGTIRSNNTSTAVVRLIELGTDARRAADALVMVVAQRLVRRLCDRCKQVFLLSERQLRELGLKKLDKMTFFTSKGCTMCHHLGYSGRIAVFEVLPVDDVMTRIIAANPSAAELHEAAVRNGMPTLRESGLKKAERGETSLDELIRATPE